MFNDGVLDDCCVIVELEIGRKTSQVSKHPYGEDEKKGQAMAISKKEIAPLACQSGSYLKGGGHFIRDTKSYGRGLLSNPAIFLK